MYDLIVIGGGPAGLTAAVYALRKRLNVLLVTRDLGGKTNYRLALPWIEDYQVIRGLEIVDKFRRELEYLSFARCMEKVDKVEKASEGYKVLTRSGDELHAKALVIATGTRQKFLEVPGEKEFMMRGLCYSAISYAPLFIDRSVIVVGDGDLALRSSAELATIGKRVYLVRSGEAGMDTPLAVKLHNSPNVTVLQGYSVVKVNGDEYARSLTLTDPTGEETEISADGIFIEKALVPNSQLVADLVALDAEGRVQVDYANRTNQPGIFAAGDVSTTFAEQVLVAVGDGAKAVLSAYDYLLPSL
jgi:NADH-dependent peroxiredoxin subunit F